jgi:transcriptional regulator with XRE-family HTH domain
MDSIDRKYEKMVSKIAANIAAIRKRRGITQEEMADHGYSYRHYQRIESGKHSPSLYTLFRLSQTFKVDINDFLK